MNLFKPFEHVGSDTYMPPANQSYDADGFRINAWDNPALRVDFVEPQYRETEPEGDELYLLLGSPAVDGTVEFADEAA